MYANPSTAQAINFEPLLFKLSRARRGGGLAMSKPNTPLTLDHSIIPGAQKYAEKKSTDRDEIQNRIPVHAAEEYQNKRGPYHQRGGESAHVVGRPTP